MNRFATYLTLAMIALSGAMTAQSRPRPPVHALIIGIDAYPQSPLPNCENDAKDIATLLRARGVPAANIKVLTNSRATRRGILQGLGWLAKTAKTGDAIVYYSGHGTRTKDDADDEADGWDEAWVACDLRIIRDDELNKLLARIPARVTVLSDSCHSGTVTKEVELGHDGIEVAGRSISGAKYFDPMTLKAAQETVGVPVEAGLGMVPRDIVVAVAAQQRQNVTGGSASGDHGLDVDQVFLLASCSDQEVSNATRRRNSAFTEHLLRALMQAPPGATFGWVRQYCDARLRNGGYRFPQHPALSGVRPDQRLPSVLQRPRQHVQHTDGSQHQTARQGTRRIAEIVHGLFRREDRAAARRAPFIAAASTVGGKKRYRTGEDVGLEIKVSRKAPGPLYACVINVGPTGNMTLLYPNKHSRNPRVKPGTTLRLPDHSGYRYPLQGKPGSESLVIYLLEWDPFVGLDWDQVGDHTFLSSKPRTQARRTRQVMLQARDIVVAPRPRRPGEGWDKRVITVDHR